MSKKYKFIFSGIAFALVAIIVGLCFVFFGNKTIKAIPQMLEVKKVEGDYYIVCQHNAQYSYQFKLEQSIDGEFMVVGIVNSQSNTIKLEDSNLNVIAGGEYRFSARYINENGGGKSKFSEELTWSPSWALKGVDYQTVTFENDLLKWQVVPSADKYTVVVVGTDLQEKVFSCEAESCDLSELDAGQYIVYVIADSFDNFVESSSAGEGKSILIKRVNILTNAQVRMGTLTVESEYDIESIEVFANGISLGSLSAGQRVDGLYQLENLISIFDNVDVENCEITIKSKACGCVLESTQTKVVFK